MKIANELIDNLRNHEGFDTEAFGRAMSEVPSTSIRLNRRKCTDVTQLGYGNLEPVTWCASGYYLDERPNFTLNPLLHAGVFYVQDASSMIYETIVRRLVEQRRLGSRPAVADLCAAPGGKTTAIINALPDGSFVLANEFVAQRSAILKENLLKWGYPEIAVTNSPTGRLAAIGESFHLIAVDAPCSGEGMMRKDDKAVQQWTPGLVASCARLQREILDDAVQMLLPGGYLLYSTCTFNTTENEEQLAYLVERHRLAPVDTGLAQEFGIHPSFSPTLPALRFMPHITRGEGLFAALLQKPGTLDTTSRGDLRKRLAAKAKLVLDGIPQTQLKGKTEIPASESLLATNYDRSRFAECELDTETALRYLRHEAVTLPPDTPRGHVAVCYHGHPLGLVKNIGNRANNLYPAAWRIRQNIDQ